MQGTFIPGWDGTNGDVWVKNRFTNKGSEMSTLLGLSIVVNDQVLS